MILRMLAIWSVSSASSKPSLYIQNFLVHILPNPSLKDFEHKLASMWNEFNCAVVWAFFGIALLWDWNENGPFPVLWWLLHFPYLVKYLVQHLTASTFGIWNRSTGIPSPLLALVVVMLRKAHLNSHFRMSGSRWMTTPLWLSRSLRPFLYNYLYFCHLLLIAFAFVRSLPFLFFIMPLLAWNVPLIFRGQKKRSFVFPILL